MSGNLTGHLLIDGMTRAILEYRNSNDARNSVGCVSAAGLALLALLARSAGPAAPRVEAVDSRCSSSVPGVGYAGDRGFKAGNAGLRGAVQVFYGARGGLAIDSSGLAQNDRYPIQDSPRGCPEPLRTVTPSALPACRPI